MLVFATTTTPLPLKEPHLPPILVSLDIPPHYIIQNPNRNPLSKFKISSTILRLSPNQHVTMSHQSSSSTFASTSYSFSSSTSNNETHSHSRIATSDPHGTRVYERSQEPGKEAREERSEWDAQGRRVDGRNSGQTGRIEDVTDREKEKEKEYEERMEEEYAKREGGA